MKTCEYLEMKHYSWRGIRQIPTYTGKVKRAVQQFTPYSWTKFEWEATKNFKHFAIVIMLIAIVRSSLAVKRMATDAFCRCYRANSTPSI